MKPMHIILRDFFRKKNKRIRFKICASKHNYLFTETCQPDIISQLACVRNGFRMKYDLFCFPLLTGN